jgi:hypothetical protein
VPFFPKEAGDDQETEQQPDDEDQANPGQKDPVIAEKVCQINVCHDDRCATLHFRQLGRFRLDFERFTLFLAFLA